MILGNIITVFSSVTCFSGKIFAIVVVGFF